MNKTFQSDGVTYTVRALSESETQDGINIAIDLLQQIAVVKGWQIDEDKQTKTSGYPYSIRNEAINYSELFVATSFSEAPKHAMPKNTLEAIDVKVFEQWLTDMHNGNGLKAKWVGAFNEANKQDTSPQASSGDETHDAS